MMVTFYSYLSINFDVKSRWCQTGSYANEKTKLVCKHRIVSANSKKMSIYPKGGGEEEEKMTDGKSLP